MYYWTCSRTWLRYHVYHIKLAKNSDLLRSQRCGSLTVPPEDEINQEAKTRREKESRGKEDEARRQKYKILDLVKSTSSGREDKKTRSRILSSRLDEDEKTKSQDHWSRQVDLMRMRRREDKIQDLVISTWWGWEDEKETRAWISSDQLHEEEKTGRRDTGCCQLELIWTRRQENKILDLVKSTSSEREDIKTRSMHPVKSTWLGREDKKTRSRISSSQIHEDEKTR